MPESMTSSYVIYLASTPDQLWAALVDNDLRKQWWRGHYVESTWQPGAELAGYFPDGSLEVRGTVLESDPPRKLRYECQAVWNDQFANDLNRLAFEIEPYQSLVKLAFTYEASEQLVTMASGGWPAVFSSLKSLLETGKPLNLTDVFGPERNPSRQ